MSELTKNLISHYKLEYELVDDKYHVSIIENGFILKKVIKETLLELEDLMEEYRKKGEEDAKRQSQRHSWLGVDMEVVNKYASLINVPYETLISSIENQYISRSINTDRTDIEKLEICRFHILISIWKCQSERPDDKLPLAYYFKYLKFAYHTTDLPCEIDLELFTELIKMSSAVSLLIINNEPFVKNNESFSKTFLIKGIEEEAISVIGYKPVIKLVCDCIYDRTYLNFFEIQIPK
jgi:hypothetical protein